VALGHRRLAVIGTGNGAQPLVSEDGKIRAAVNGEFYGFDTIRRELSRRGHRFRTDSDSEILLHLYEDSGDACLQELRGEFAFVLWDGIRQRLFAARDRFGIKPLLYAEYPGGIISAFLRTLGDGTEMPSSVEGRVPFLDHRLFELMREAPLDLKVRGMTEKFILREAARDVLTDSVYRREKHPFDLDLFQSTGAEFELGALRELSQRGLVCPIPDRSFINGLLTRILA
jgi:asparagine synthetase B (glutamine-hydrolysing)